MATTKSSDVLIIGGGAVGAAVAYELSHRGLSVRLLERANYPAAGCSSSNAGLIAPSHVEPLATPSLVAQGMKTMFLPNSPFYVSPSPRLVPGMLRLATSALPMRTRLLSERMREMASRSLEIFAQYDSQGLITSFRRNGLMDVFLTDKRFHQTVNKLERFDDSLPYKILTSQQAREMEPSLGNIAGGVLRPDEAQCESREFVRSMLNHAQANGAVIHWAEPVENILSKNGLIQRLDTAHGNYTAETVIFASGLGTQHLAHKLGISLPMLGGKGYVLDVHADGDLPKIPLSIREPRVVATPYTSFLRMCGTMEISTSNNDLDQRRLETIPQGIMRALPRLDIHKRLETRAGQRPCTVDGVPVIGRSQRIRNAVFAAGHGMWGLTLAPITAELIARGLTGNEPTLHEPAFSPDRFSQWWSRLGRDTSQTSRLRDTGRRRAPLDRRTTPGSLSLSAK